MNAARNGIKRSVVILSLSWVQWPANGIIRARKLLKAMKRQYDLVAEAIIQDDAGTMATIYLRYACSFPELQNRLNRLKHVARLCYKCHITSVRYKSDD